MIEIEVIITALIIAFTSILFRFFLKRRFRKFEVSYSLAIDGDTLFVGHGKPRIRLYGIDAPEIKQPSGPDSQAALRNLTKDENLIIQPVNVDKYNRIVAKVLRSRDGLDINAAMVSQGYALAETAFTKAYKHHERKARRGKRGLWSSGGITSPKKFRRQQNSAF